MNSIYSKFSKMIALFALLSLLSFAFSDSGSVAAASSVDASSVTFWFFSKKNPANGVVITPNTLSTLGHTSFDASKDTIFIVHGWKNTNQSDFLNTVRSAILTNLNVNLFVVDWSKLANKNYISAASKVGDVGNYLAQFIESLVAVYKINLARTTLVGHSLGGQVVGDAGASLKGKIGVIVGLDPALPGFLTAAPKDRLDPTDAQFVHAIHTNGGLKGFPTAVGNADYFPNGGKRQPGCGTDLLGSCAHARAFMYYAESLAGGAFVGRACGSYKDFSAGKCKSGKTSLMGRYPVDKRALGNYYLDTNDKSPFARG